MHRFHVYTHFFHNDDAFPCENVHAGTGGNVFLLSVYSAALILYGSGKADVDCDLWHVIAADVKFK